MTKYCFWFFIFGMLSFSSFIACERAAPRSGDRPLAKAFNRTLYLSEMAGMFPPGEDSSLIINAYVERWIRETLLLLEAERNIPGDLNIDKLVRDYRASLVRYSYEQFLVEQLLDSTVTKAELEAFYENNKAQYQLETPIIRCYFIKVPLPVFKGEELRKLWNSDKPEDFQKLVRYCSEFAESHLLEENTWHKLEDITMEFPQGILTVDNLGSRREITMKDEQFEYYLRIMEWKNQRDIAPLSYIEDQARRFILRSRIDQLLEDKKHEMYELELRRGNVQILTK